ncbi:hypothetical protein GCM10029963_72380 [Micromonospora andamanensis]
MAAGSDDPGQLRCRRGKVRPVVQAQRRDDHINAAVGMGQVRHVCDLEPHAVVQRAARRGPFGNLDHVRGRVDTGKRDVGAAVGEFVQQPPRAGADVQDRRRLRCDSRDLRGDPPVEAA